MTSSSSPPPSAPRDPPDPSAPPEPSVAGGSSPTAAARAEVAAASRRLAAEGLLVGTAGNVSARVGDLVAVTATGVVLADARPDDVTVVALDGTPVEGDLAPTSELELHLGIHRTGTAAAVVHTHSPLATALSLVLDELPVVHYQQLVLGGAIRTAPFAVFGSPELAAHVHAALEGRAAALMANHGAVALGGSLGAVVENALLLEWACGLYWRAAALGTPRTLAPEQQRAVIEAATRSGYGRTHRLDDPGRER